MKKIILTVLIACAMVAAHADKATSAPSEVIELWNDVKMPGGVTEPLDYSKKKWKPSVEGVKNPTLEIFPARGAKDSGFVIICPGGAYANLADTSAEGYDIAEFFNRRGVSAAVLKYRIPNNFDGALMDAQRAIRLVRANAKKWGANPDKIAIMGFSAGANLSARASTNFKNPAYAPLDDIDKLSARPDYTVLIYPAYCSQPEKDRRMLGKRTASQDYSARYEIADWNVVDKDTPPAFITQSQFDPYVDAAIAYYLALKKFGVPAELHMISKGAHGYKDPEMFELLSSVLNTLHFY